MSPTPAATIGPPVQIEFDDNRLLPMLFGEHDRNLAHVEQVLGVQLVTRGNRLAITGPEDAVAIAQRALTALYQSLKRGHQIDRPEVDAALRLARGEHAGEPSLFGPLSADGTAVKTQRRQIRPRSAGQARYVEALREADLVLAVGPAGTGKTYLAVAIAVAMLAAGNVDRIVLSRPAVEAGERLGFLPGDLREKIDPYLRPLYDALYDMMPAEQVMKRLSSGEIEIAPLAFMRGRTLSNSFVILDEAQNTTPVQMKMFLTRLGENSRMAVTGDLSQVDLPAGARSGLAEALTVLDGVEGVGILRFTEADVVRHPLVTRIVRAYDRHTGDRSNAAPTGPGNGGSER